MTSLILAIARILGFIKTLLVPIAFVVGKALGRAQQQEEQDKINTEAQKEYDEIEKKDVSDEDVDKRLDEGSI